MSVTCGVYKCLLTRGTEPGIHTLGDGDGDEEGDRRVAKGLRRVQEDHRDRELPKILYRFSSRYLW